VQRAQQLMDIEIAKTAGKLHWTHWKKVKGSDMSDEHSDWVPRNVLYFNTFVEDLFNTKDKAEAFAMIEQAMPFLKSLEGSRLQGGPAQNKFNNLFEIEEVTTSSEVDLENPDDDDLRSLEEGIINES
jgi:hypothetical protein